MKIKLDFGDLQDDDSPSDDVDKSFDFAQEFESNGTYLVQIQVQRQGEYNISQEYTEH